MPGPSSGRRLSLKSLREVPRPPYAPYTFGIKVKPLGYLQKEGLEELVTASYDPRGTLSRPVESGFEATDVCREIFGVCRYDVE